jgi:hypothetical protein
MVSLIMRTMASGPPKDCGIEYVPSGSVVERLREQRSRGPESAIRSAPGSQVQVGGSLSAKMHTYPP